MYTVCPLHVQYSHRYFGPVGQIISEQHFFALIVFRSVEKVTEGEKVQERIVKCWDERLVKFHWRCA